jgi:hypothetical protein
MLCVRTFPHDFGSYREVVVVFDSNDAKAAELALKAEGAAPEEWDDEAREELRVAMKAVGVADR